MPLFCNPELRDDPVFRQVDTQLLTPTVDVAPKDSTDCFYLFTHFPDPNLRLVFEEAVVPVLFVAHAPCAHWSSGHFELWSSRIRHSTTTAARARREHEFPSVMQSRYLLGILAAIHSRTVLARFPG